MEVIYKSDPPYDVWLKLVTAAHNSDLWCLAESDYQLWNESFGKDYEMIVAYEKNALEPLGCICCATYNHSRHNEKTSILGLFYVVEEYRGRGIGNTLFQKIIKDKLDNNLYLNACPSMIEKYKIHYNFTFQHSWRNILHRIAPTDINYNYFTDDDLEDNIVVYNPGLLTPVLLYDSFIQGDLDRTQYISRFLISPCADSKIAMSDTGEITGLAVGRLVMNEILFIGPLYANNKTIAKKLLYSLLKGKYKDSYREIQIQTVSANREGLTLLLEISDDHVEEMDYSIGLSTRFELKTIIPKVFSITEYDLSFI